MSRAIHHQIWPSSFVVKASVVLTGLLLVGPADPLPASVQASVVEDLSTQAFQEWQVLEVNTARTVTFQDWMTELASSDVIYLGEEHRNRFHVEAALKILDALLARDRQPVLAIEMFGWDGQAGLDRYLSDREATRDRFLEESRWEQNWGGAYEDYEPLINLARERHLPVLALNPPRSLVRRVATQGLARALADPDMNRWGMRNELLFDEPAYRDVILKQLHLCHAGLSENDYRRMYEASIFRDEGMAKTISSNLRNARAGMGPVVSYTGSGHIQYRLPVPNRVQRRWTGSVKQTTVYLTSFEPGRTEEIRELLRDAVADYVWLTPLSAHGAPRRCR
ncbi:MAG TPA: ChaN family lipoprotein [Nitrospiraceae bacterium]|nr:ChaN family lipoprotein [Nitrospiraceae bacterium]